MADKGLKYSNPRPEKTAPGTNGKATGAETTVQQPKVKVDSGGTSKDGGRG